MEWARTLPLYYEKLHHLFSCAIFYSCLNFERFFTRAFWKNGKSLSSSDRSSQNRIFGEIISVSTFDRFLFSQRVKNEIRSFSCVFYFDMLVSILLWYVNHKSCFYVCEKRIRRRFVANECKHVIEIKVSGKCKWIFPQCCIHFYWKF